MNWYSLTVEEVKKILFSNQQGKRGKSLEYLSNNNQFNKLIINHKYNF